MPDRPAKLDRSRHAEATRLSKARRFSEEAAARPRTPDPLTEQARRYVEIPLAERDALRARAEEESARRAAEDEIERQSDEAEYQAAAARRGAEIEATLASQAAARAAWVRDILADKVPHLSADDLGANGALPDWGRLVYIQTERAFAARLMAELRRCKTRFTQPPSEKAATQWWTMEMFGSREAGRLLERTIRDAHDKIDRLIRSTPNARETIEDIFDEADIWRRNHGPAGDITAYRHVGSGEIKIILRNDGTREVVPITNSVALSLWGGGPETEALLDWADNLEHDRRHTAAASTDADAGRPRGRSAREEPTKEDRAEARKAEAVSRAIRENASREVGADANEAGAETDPETH
jgi:hypothetical protein